MTEALPATPWPLRSVIWSAAGWIGLVGGFFCIFYVVDLLLPPLDGGILRAGLRGAVSTVLICAIYQASRVTGHHGRQLRAATARAEMLRDPEGLVRT